MGIAARDFKSLNKVTVSQHSLPSPLCSQHLPSPCIPPLVLPLGLSTSNALATPASLQPGLWEVAAWGAGFDWGQQWCHVGFYCLNLFLG